MNESDTSSETARVEAFSDGVIAIIITIMVLELRPPEHPTLGALLRLWPILLAYGLSFAQVGIYWVNHHQLLMRAERSTNGLRWSNLVWLFALSLIPFGTAWWGEHPGQSIPTAFYLLTLLLPAIVYPWLEGEALCHSAPDDTTDEHRLQRRKTLASLIVYAAGIALAFIVPALSLVCIAIVAVLWVIPGGKADGLFGRRGR